MRQNACLLALCFTFAGFDTCLYTHNLYLYVYVYLFQGFVRTVPIKRSWKLERLRKNTEKKNNNAEVANRTEELIGAVKASLNSYQGQIDAQNSKLTEIMGILHQLVDASRNNPTPADSGSENIFSDDNGESYSDTVENIQQPIVHSSYKE